MSREALTVRLQRARSVATAAGIIGIGLSAVALWLDRERFFQAYLASYWVLLGLALGPLALLMLHHLTGGRWGLAARPALAAAAGTAPLFAILFLPLVIGLHLGWHHLYRWADASVLAAEPVLRAKVRYLNIPAFELRAALYFGVWIVLALVMVRGVARLERGATRAYARRLQKVSGPGLALYGATITFAAIDWGMSLEPEWYSGIYGVIYAMGQILSGLALGTLVFVLMGRAWNADDEATPVDPQHDLGNLLLAFVMLWTYTAFSQYLLIYSGNISEEATWYVRRGHGGWEYLALALGAFQFALPFALLLSRRLKRNAKWLAAIATWILIMRVVDAYWQIMPAFSPRFVPHWIDVAPLLALGGIWAASYVTLLGRRDCEAVYGAASQLHAGGHHA